MLLEFKSINYKSFKDELIFSMIPVSEQRKLDYSILQEKVDNNIYKGLSSAVIYGANASGKTNIIGAMDTFKSIVLRGNIRNEENTPQNIASCALELIPNNLYEEPEPVEFSIKFIEQNILFEYSFSMDVGIFLKREYNRKVLTESLKINDKILFIRDKELEIYSDNLIEGYLVNDFEKYAKGVNIVAKNNLNNEELFLMNGFKNLFSSKIVNIISNWLNNKFMVIYRSESIQLIRKFTDFEKEAVYIDKNINDIAKLFGTNSNKLGYTIDDKSGEGRLSSVFDVGKVAIPAEIFESYGTIRFLNLFPLVVKVLRNGGTLIIDEFDASIHPMALMNIVMIFHNDEINKEHAQLIFNTHNPIFLNENIFRRDEIKFVERDDSTYCSTHYSLSDFKEERENEDYMKNYFVNRYGAINDIDFTPIFEKILLAKEKKEV